jgi:hypothetical protein
MGQDYDVQLTRKDGSVRNFRIFGQSPPHGRDVVTLPVDGQIVKARITEPSYSSEADQSPDQAHAVEV